MEGHVAMEEWKDPSPGPESLMPGIQTGAFPPDAIRGERNNEGGKAGFEKHGFSAAISPPREEGRGRLLPLTPQFGHKSGAGSRLGERLEARGAFRVPRLSVPLSAPAGADNAVPGAPSPYLTIPPGLSPATLLESPVFLSNAMGQASPTTGKLFVHGGTNDIDPIRFGGPPLGDGPGVFSFKPLELKSSHYTAEEKKQSPCINQLASLPSKQVSVKIEAKNHSVQEANLLGQLNQQKSNEQANAKSVSHDTAAGNEHASPPDHGQAAEEGDAGGGGGGGGEYPAMAAAAPAEDGYSWRKYGQKQVKHSEYPRSYYKCTHPGCQVKKKVERSHEGHITEIIYKGTHNHPKPPQSRRPGVPPVHPFGDAADAADDPAAAGPHQAEARQGQPTWHNNGGGDGADAAPSPSVPGELCESSASMKVQDGTPEGAGVASAVSDEVDGDDRVTRGSLSQGGADAEGDELESKRRKLEAYAIDMSTASRAVREPRVVIQTTSEVDILDDGYRWRKYGQKVVKGNPNPRSYYKCTHPGCSVRKHVERASHDLKSVITTYEGKHNHEVPAARNSGHPGSTAAPAPGAGGGGARSRPEHNPSLALHDGGLLMRHLGGCGVPFGLPPPRDPLAPMGNYPFAPALGGVGGPAAALPSLPPVPAGPLGAVEGLKVPALRPLLRQRQAMEAAGLVAPPRGGEAKADGSAAAASVYQQLVRSRLQLSGHQM